MAYHNVHCRSYFLYRARIFHHTDVQKPKPSYIVVIDAYNINTQNSKFGYCLWSTFCLCCVIMMILVRCLQSVLEPVKPDSSLEKAGTGSRSAVIALSLSLTLTFILIVYLGCRYRNMRRRLGRSGKPLRGSEVDYLIDGMYL